MIDMREGNCALCGHDEVVLSRPNEFWGENGEHAQPMAVAHGSTKRFLIGAQTDKEKPFGQLTVCVCRRCGFVQWFASDPARIPIDDVDTKLVKGKPLQAPYR
jgi:hypothetical protein